ncbi:SusD/RagB family nutrient-binding outer membrane lipoprotein [Inquilinus sp. KBS0705]|nr:SusD/RagB family nutrient-binding outer membrane lipoprotein [Inquilinus sp. KBS0705]
MKKRLIYSCLLVGATFIAGCTKNFDQINTDPTKVNAGIFPPNFLLAQAQIKFSNSGYDQLLFQSMWVQSLSSTYDYYGNGDKYVYAGSGRGYLERTWNTSFGSATLVDEMKNLIKDKAEYKNLDNVGTIMRMMILQRITDAYGDIPFSQEGQAKSGIVTPVFDTQQSIYTSMLSQLDAATAALDPSKDKPSSDLFYGGDITKWKKLGYSLMLKAAMRLTKVDPATARKYAEKAYAGGTMSSVDDNAKVKADEANGNSNSDVNALLVKDDFREVRWSNVLIGYLQSTNDPRVSAVAEISAGTGKAANETQTAGINTANLQVGMPNGYDLKGGSTDISKAPGYPGATAADPAVTGDVAAPDGKYSRPRFEVYDDRSRINMLLTYGESELLLAEAAARGWNTGVAATHYANALAADIQTISQFNAAGTVAPGTIATYVAAHPLVAGTALQQINMEYYVVTSTTFNFNETWANWRRSGFPVLTPVKYIGQFTDGSIPRRIPYPLGLPSTNAANYNEAVKRLTGGDVFTARVWWDK